MSKMLKALNKAKAMKEGNYAPTIQDHVASIDNGEEEHEGVSGKSTSIQTVIFVTLIAIGVSSIMVSFKTLSELKKTKAISGALAKKISQQSTMIKDLRASMDDSASGKTYVFQRINDQMKNLRKTIKSVEKDISEVSIDYNVMRVLVNDLTKSNQALVDKYIGVSEEIDELKRVEHIIVNLPSNK